LARRLLKKLRRKSRSPGDYETELVRLCNGNRQLAEKLIAEERQKTEGLSRQGAALALVTRLRHEKSPLKASL
jgi:hypothetical protein